MTEPIQLPAFLANRPSRSTTGSLAALSVGSPPHISIKGNRFKLIDAAGNEKIVPTLHLDGVIIDSNDFTSKIYYDSGFDPNATEFKPPACFSDNGVAPSRQALKPQFATCGECPHNQWGSETSRITGKATKACNDVKKIAVLVDGMAFLMRIPPASLKPLGAYARSLAGQSVGDRSVSPEDVVTRFSFDEKAVGILQFTAAAWVDEKTAGLTAALWQQKATDDIVGRNDQPYSGAIAAPSAPALAVPQQQLPPPPAPPSAGVAAPPPPVVPPTEAPKKGRGKPAKTETDEEQMVRLQKQLDEMRQKLNPVQNSPITTTSQNMGAQVSPVGQTTDTDDIPPFLRRTADTPAAPGAAQPQFGMHPAPEPNAALMEALNLALPPANGG